MADKKLTVAFCLPRAPHLRRFSSQAAPGKNLGDSPPRVFDSFALQTSQTTIFVRSSGSGPPVLLLQSSARAGRAEVLLQPLRASEAFPSCANHRPLSRLPRGVRGSRWHAKMTMRKETRDRLHAIGCPLAPACPQEQPAGPPAACDSPGRRPRAGARSAAV